ncbi:MAG: 50S ribosomal protein L21 [candidate division Zixibacteria bacterium]|nr:50S ribosomal protein L21 [candidate division Zixibacteria bacterium]
MFAIFESGGLQFNAEVGAVLKVPYLPAKPGEMISIDKVLLVKNGENARVGTPYLSSARIEAEVLNEGQAEKVTIYKFKKRTKYRKHRGHRQLYSEIKIKKIVSPEN